MKISLFIDTSTKYLCVGIAKDNKVIYMPYEATGVLSSIGGIKELMTMSNK